MSDSLDAKIERLRELLRSLESAVIGYSGGVDSVFLAAAAHDALGARALAVTADSESLPRAHLKQARDLAAQLGLNHRVIETCELSNPRYAANNPDRCYHCKSELFARLRAVADAEGYRHVCDGLNADDTGDYRPGRKAAQEQGVRSPLLECGFTKADVREASRRRGLPTADQPASACLSSRLPYGTAVTAAALSQVERAEAALAELGFRHLRVRHHGEVARVELAPDEIPRMLDASVRTEATQRLKACGYRYVTLDLQGYRTGSLNESLPGLAAR